MFRRWGEPWLRRLVAVHPDEISGLLMAWVYGFAVFTAYAVIRPLRDALALTGGVHDLPWLFAGTLGAMIAVHPLYAWLVARTPRRVFVALTSRVFALNLALFLVLGLLLGGGAQLWLARAFFVWTSVFNLFVLSIFWSFLTDVFRRDQAARLFGFIAGGVTVGGIAGSLLTATLAEVINPLLLLPVSIALLEVAARAASRLERRSHPQVEAAGRLRIGGSPWEGIGAVASSPYLLGIVGFMLLYTVTATFLYFIQAGVVSAHLVDRGARTAFFARIDLAVNTLTIFIQALVAGRFIRRFGLRVSLVVVPVICIAGFIWLGAAPTLIAVAVFQVARRAAEYGITRPAREILYTVVGRDQRFKAKNFIDTVIYRCGDQIGAWSWAAITAAGVAAAASTWVAAPLAGLWCLLGLWLGRRCQAGSRTPVEVAVSRAES